MRPTEWSPGDASPLLLDSGLLNGPHEVRTWLRPGRPARPVVCDDIPGALREIEWACQTWGGGAHPLLPVRDASIPPIYTRLLETEQVDSVRGRHDVDVSLPWRVGELSVSDQHVLTVLGTEPYEKWRTVEVVDLAPDDPWRPIYAAVLGTWPERPTPEFLNLGFLRDDLRFEDVLPVQRQTVSGSLADLIARLRAPSLVTPRSASGVFLASGMEPDSSFMGFYEPVLPERNAHRRAAGPNIAVVVSPGSVEDVALLWNLRAAHGDRRVLPIGLPADQMTPAALALLRQPGNVTPFGFSGGKLYLVSATVPLESLRAAGDATPGIVVVPYEEVLSFGPAPGRPSTQIATWRDGRAQITPMTAIDEELLGKVPGVSAPEMLIDVTVADHHLPADGTMRGTEFFARFQAGAAQVAVRSLDRRGTVRVAWPSSWTCLAAVAHTRGLKVAESPAGLAASTLIRTLGGVADIEMFAHKPLISLVYEMAELSGMAWWKQRWRRADQVLRDAGADPSTLDDLAERLGRDTPVVAPPGEGRAVPFQRFVNALGGERAARHWIAWAEPRHLVVRGADVTCSECRARSWLPLASLPPPVICPACGRAITHPYRPRDLPFTYRLGEPLRRVLETDSLGHVLTLHWLVRLFERRGLVGAHPGVTFRHAETGLDVGEADVILLFRDGTLVPSEVKRRAAGVDNRAIDLMDTLRDALAAPYDVLAVTEPARDCPDLRTRERRLPDVPRLLLTDDQLHQDWVFWQAGRDPFAWAPMTAEQDAEREQKFVQSLAGRAPDAARDAVGETLLNPALGAYRRKEPPTDGSPDSL